MSQAFEVEAGRMKIEETLFTVQQDPGLLHGRCSIQVLQRPRYRPQHRPSRSTRQPDASQLCQVDSGFSESRYIRRQPRSDRYRICFRTSLLTLLLSYCRSVTG